MLSFDEWREAVDYDIYTDFEEYYKLEKRLSLEDGDSEEDVENEKEELLHIYNQEIEDREKEYDEFKKKMIKLETKSDDHVICPHCGYKEEGHFDGYGTFETECSFCGKEYYVSHESRLSYNFSTYISECKNRKHKEVYWSGNLINVSRPTVWYRNYFEIGICANCRENVYRYYGPDKKLISKRYYKKLKRKEEPKNAFTQANIKLKTGEAGYGKTYIRIITDVPEGNRKIWKLIQNKLSLKGYEISLNKSCVFQGNSVFVKKGSVIFELEVESVFNNKTILFRLFDDDFLKNAEYSDKNRVEVLIRNVIKIIKENTKIVCIKEESFHSKKENTEQDIKEYYTKDHNFKEDYKLFDFSNIYYERKFDMNGKTIKQGELKYTLVNGRVFKGNVYYRQCYWFFLINKKYILVLPENMFDKPNKIKGRFCSNRKERLEKELKKEEQARNYEKCIILRDILKSEEK